MTRPSSKPSVAYCKYRDGEKNRDGVNAILHQNHSYNFDGDIPLLHRIAAMTDPKQIK